jgi:hypothetical protein
MPENMMAVSSASGAWCLLFATDHTAAAITAAVYSSSVQMLVILFALLLCA